MIVIGGGQAGLAVGYHLARTGVRFVILDAQQAHRRLHGASAGTRCACSRRRSSTAWMGCRFPHRATTSRRRMRWRITWRAMPRASPAGSQRNAGRPAVQARPSLRDQVREPSSSKPTQVVVAMANYQQPSVPAFAGAPCRESRRCIRPPTGTCAQLQPGGVLHRGRGQFRRRDRARRRPATVTCPAWRARAPVQIPFRPESFLGRHLLQPLCSGPCSIAC